MKKIQSKLPPVCPVCELKSSPFSIVERTVEQEFRGDTLLVTVELAACRRCDFKIYSSDQASVLVHRTLDAYRAKHKLLSPTAIVAGRKRLGMTQAQFAKHLGFSLPSIKRWERGYVQDANSDQRIREKLATAETPAERLFRALLADGKSKRIAVDGRQFTLTRDGELLPAS